MTASGEIAAGDILIENSSHLPHSLLLQSDSGSNGWARLNGAHSTFEEEMRQTGWTLFFMAGEIKAFVFGFDRQKTLRAALKRLIAGAKSQHCNSIEITRVANKSFLKMPYTSLSAHPRHLQKGQVFSGGA